MSTIPFTLIEGPMALPRLRPLGHLPAPFGRDWALLPPGYSLRAELKALYAAMLRTFCMSDQTIRSLCKWAPQDKRRAAKTPSAATAGQPTAFDAPHDGAAHMAVEAAAVSPVEEPTYAAVSRGATSHWGTLTGGTCVLGGAAVLAWIAFGHLAHRHTAGETKFVGTAPATRDSPPTQLRAAGAGKAPVVVSGEANASAPGVAAATVIASGPSTFAPPSSSSAAYAFTVAAPSAHVSANKSISHRRDNMRETTRRHDKENRRHTAQIATANQPSHVAAMANDLPRVAIPASASQVSPKPSAAGPYSPPAPTRLGVDEYDAVTMSAATHLRDIAPPSRPASSNNPSRTSGTEWMNRMSQRRVTEIPDHFTK